jgi:DNA-binding transcriptional ArsR family regulator
MVLAGGRRGDSEAIASLSPIDRQSRVSLARQVHQALQLDRAFRALADPSRRWIVEWLLDTDASVQQFAETLPMSLSAVAQHVRVLEECGLVRTRKVGRKRVCSIVPDALCTAEHWLRKAMWARYRGRLGSLPEDWPLGALR